MLVMSLILLYYILPLNYPRPMITGVNCFATVFDNLIITIPNNWVAGTLPEGVETVSPSKSRKYRPLSSPLFTGRQEILGRLENYFQVREAGQHQRREFLLHGLGGAGKTQIMLKFAETYQTR